MCAKFQNSLSKKKIHIAVGWKLVEIVEVALNTTANFTPLSVNDVKVKLS